LGGEYVKTIYEIIHQESIRQQSEIMSSVKNGSEEPAQSPAT
jgi:arginine repressor